MARSLASRFSFSGAVGMIVCELQAPAFFGLGLLVLAFAFVAVFAFTLGFFFAAMTRELTSSGHG